MLEDMVRYAAPRRKPKPPRRRGSGIYRGEDEDTAISPTESAGNNPFLSGLTGLGQTYRRLPVASLGSVAALPMMGDPMPIIEATSGSPTGIRGRKKLKASLDGSGMGGGSGNDISMMPPMFHTPGNAQDAYMEPKSYVEQIRWARLMYNGNPYIYSITNLKAYYPYSRYRLSTSEPWITKWYESVAERKDFSLYSHILRMSLQRKKFGEAINMMEKRQDGFWPQTGQPRWIIGSMVMLEPELIDIKKPRFGNAKTRYFMRPNRDLEEFARALEKGDDEETRELKARFPLAILQKIQNHEPVELDGELISVIADLTDASAVRGTPPYMPLYKAFILEDFVRLALMAQAYRWHFPIELWLLGNVDKNYMPTPKDVSNLKRVVTAALANPPFAIFFPPLLTYEAKGVQGQLTSITENMLFIQKQYLVGMGVSEEMILGSSAIFSSNDTSGNQAFIRMMEKDRDEMETWMKWQFFEPLAQWNNLKTNNNGVLAPVIPEIEWRKVLDFKAAQDDKENLQWLWDQKLVDPGTVITRIGNMNPEEVAIKIGKAVDGPFDVDNRFGSEEFRKKLGSRDTGGAGAGGAAPEEAAVHTEAPGGDKAGKGAGQPKETGAPAEAPEPGESTEAPSGQEVKI